MLTRRTLGHFVAFTIALAVLFENQVPRKTSDSSSLKSE